MNRERTERSRCDEAEENVSTGLPEAFHMEKASALLPHSALWVGPEL